VKFRRQAEALLSLLHFFVLGFIQVDKEAVVLEVV
jgi:hypothetical protein